MSDVIADAAVPALTGEVDLGGPLGRLDGSASGVAVRAVLTEAVAVDPMDYDDMDDECGNCGGEGVIYDCIDGCCAEAELGCDLCARRCDWCSP